MCGFDEARARICDDGSSRVRNQGNGLRPSRFEKHRCSLAHVVLGQADHSSFAACALYQESTCPRIFCSHDFGFPQDLTGPFGEVS
jgi:hypothetical protein